MRKGIVALLMIMAVSLPACFAAAEEIPDLSGNWLTEDNDGSWMEAEIEGDVISINWVSDNGDTKAIYWVGSYIAPEEAAEEYSWTSERDAEKTATALLASTSDTKEFTYKDGAISTEVGALGTTTVRYFYPEGEEAGEDTDLESKYQDLLEKYNQLQEQYDQLKADYDALVGESSDEAEIDDDSSVKTEINTEDLTMGQKNALSQAESYLKLMSFSYTGLIDQLEYEGYSIEDATFAADNCGADWNEQAVKQAESYLDFMSFSRDGLISQLEYEGFTTEQANYAADAVGY